MQVWIRVSQRGVPHTIVSHRGHQFSVCYMGKKNLYRIWNWDTQEKLLDIDMQPGGSTSLEFVIDALVNKIENGKEANTTT